MTQLNLGRFVPLLGLLLSLATPAFGATYYIDFASGNDNNSGSSTNAAWRTIPGTRTLNGGSFLRTDYGRGTLTQDTPLKPGTVLAIKRGTTHKSSNGGFIWLDKHFYGEGATSKNPISIVAATGWGTGPVTIDGSLIPAGAALIIVQQDGIRIDGKGTDGICVKNSPKAGLMIKEKAGTNESVDQCAVVQVKFLNNGLSYLTDLAGSGSGQINVRKANGLRLDKVTLDGDNNYINGVIMGDNHMTVVNALVTNSKAYRHKGDLLGNDSGIGFKALNGQVEFRGCISHDNLKGFDLGEADGDNAEILYKIINCLSYANTWGANMNAANTGDYTGAVNFYVINSLIYNNSVQGINAYAGPFNLHVVHTVFANNGGNPNAGKATGHLRVTPDSLRDDGAIRVYLYNNIYYQASQAALTTSYFEHGVNFLSLDSDYNAYVQTGPGLFFRWAYFDTGESRDFAFGANGQGNPLGEWARFYGDDTTRPASGMTGHFGCDTHSKGTGAEDSTLPQFQDVARRDFRLQTHCTGANLEAQAWFIPEMGIDHSGKPRVAWDMGAFEAAN